MQGILYVSHGSRIAEARLEAMEFIISVKKLVDIELQEICFLELAEPNVEQGIENLIIQGATKISIVPVLLLSAGHFYHDIPEEIQQIKEKHPEIEFSYGRPLGVQDRLTAILKDRIYETNIPIHGDAKVLVVGRGSTNPQTKTDIESIGQKLQEILSDGFVDVCYLAACKPSFEEAMQNSLKEGRSQVFVVPYLWFTGVLEGFIEGKINDLQTDIQVVLCHHLGYHPTMKQALKERVYESLEPAYRF